MRTSFRVLAAAAAASAGLLAFAAPSSMASAPSPDCESGASTVVCDSFGGTVPVTWTIVVHFDGTTSTDSYSTTTSTTTFGCERGELFNVTYSYVAGGVTQTSGPAAVACNTGPWE